MKYFYLYVALLAAILGLGMWYEVLLWNECRETNSFLYCLRVLGK